MNSNMVDKLSYMPSFVVNNGSYNQSTTSIKISPTLTCDKNYDNITIAHGIKQSSNQYSAYLLKLSTETKIVSVDNQYLDDENIKQRLYITDDPNTTMLWSIQRYSIMYIK